MSNRGVWITGVGAVTPLGHDFRTIGDRLLAGDLGAIRVIDEHAAASQELPACLAVDPPLPTGWDEAAFRQFRRSDQFGLWSASAALGDAGFAANLPRP